VIGRKDSLEREDGERALSGREEALSGDVDGVEGVEEGFRTEGGTEAETGLDADGEGGEVELSVGGRGGRGGLRDSIHAESLRFQVHGRSFEHVERRRIDGGVGEVSDVLEG